MGQNKLEAIASNEVFNTIFGLGMIAKYAEGFLLVSTSGMETVEMESNVGIVDIRRHATAHPS